MGTLGAINRSINHQAIRSFVLKPAHPPALQSVSQLVYLGVSFRVGERVFTLKGQFTVSLSVSQSVIADGQKFSANVHLPLPLLVSLYS